MGGSARTFVLVAVSVAAVVAAPYLAPFIEAGLGAIGVDALGTAITLLEAGAAPEIAAGIASAVVPVVTGAVTGAAAGGGNAAIQGQDVWEGAFTGAAAGGVAGGVSSAVGSFLPTGTPDAVQAGVRGAASGFTSAELRGKDLETALKTGLISGGTAGLTNALLPSGFLGGGQTAEDYVTDEEGMFVYDAKGNPVLTEDAKTSADLSNLAEKTAKGFGGAFIKQNLSSLFSSDPSPQSSSRTRPAPSDASAAPGYTSPSTGYTATGKPYQPSTTGEYVPSTAQTTGQSGQVPGSQALAQALRVGDPGDAIASPAGEGNQQSVWNTSSLRFKDETGSEA